jgi:hypothetical protein
MPSVEFGTDHASPVGTTAMSRTAFETSIPTNVSTGLRTSFAVGGRRTGRGSSLRMRARGPRICTSSFPKSVWRPTLSHGLEDLRVNDLPDRSFFSASSRCAGERSVALPHGARGTGVCERQRATPREIQG